MPRKKIAPKVNTPATRIRENSRLMHTHESMVDFINGRTSMNSFLDVFAPSLFSQTFSHLETGGFNFNSRLEDDIIYSDDDDDDDDDDDYDDCFPRSATNRPLQPHPQIRQLTDEEADRIAKELMQEEERRKEKTEKNKRKKMRKKEKKRLERENEVKDNSNEEEKEKSESSENQEEVPLIETTPKVNEAPPAGKSQNSPEATKGDESGGDTEEKNVQETKEKKEKEDPVLPNSIASPAKSVKKKCQKAEETSEKKPAKEKPKEKIKLPEVKPPEDVKSDAAEKPAVRSEKPESVKVIEEKTLDPAADELAKRSVELAMIGNHLAAAGQFEQAVQCFTDAIKHNPKEFKLFGNRSFCYEKIQQYENALQDADVALSMEPNWIKGLFRKGKALCGLKKYYEASLIYNQVLSLEKTSVEAAQELKRAQTLHLMEMGFTWAKSTEALKSHATLEEAVDALFLSNHHASPEDDVNHTVEQPAAKEEATADGADNGGWTVLQTNRHRTQHAREFGENRPADLSPMHRARNSVKPELFSVWVGTLSDTMTYTRLHELFSRTGTIYSIKMLLEQQCAFVNYTRKEDCERAIQCIHGMMLDGAPLTVRYPFRGHTESGATQSAATEPHARSGPPRKECFFWRTTGCTRSDCTFRHVPEHKNMDRERFTSRLGWLGNHS